MTATNKTEPSTSDQPQEHHDWVGTVRSTTSRTNLIKKHGQPFLPTLFDRLRDDAPSQKTEAPDAYIVSKAHYRNLVQRDLNFLLNCTNQADLLNKQRYAAASASTINYGVPALAGGYLSERKWFEIEDMLRQAILNFEPRLIPETLHIRPIMKDGAHAQYNILLFEVKALLHASPYPMEFVVQSAIDLETSRIEMQHAA